MNSSTSAATSPSANTANNRSLAVGAISKLVDKVREKWPFSAGQGKDGGKEESRFKNTA